jgi:hypothetical protein
MDYLFASFLKTQAQFCPLDLKLKNKVLITSSKYCFCFFVCKYIINSFVSQLFLAKDTE